MKKIIFTLAIFFLYVNNYAQNTYENGYFINNTGQRINCLIKNIVWQSNPTEFQYKLLVDEKPKVAKLVNVKEFGIIDKSKYIRFNGDIDRSSEVTANLSKDRNPVFNKEQLFLKVLVEGKASLYAYRDSNLSRYFYKTDNSDIQQLIYKSYISYSINKQVDMFNKRDYIKKNTQYKQQLWKDLKCKSISIKDIEKLQYKEKELVSLFTKYNQTMSGIQIFDEKTRQSFHLTLRPRIGNSHINWTYVGSGEEFLDLEDKNNSLYGFGVEAEFVLPFHNIELSLFFEPLISYYNTSRSHYISRFELPVGARYNFYLKDNSKLFINGSYNFFIPEIAIGLGYRYKNKYNFELKYGSSNSTSSYYKTTTTNLSVIFGYDLF